MPAGDNAVAEMLKLLQFEVVVEIWKRFEKRYLGIDEDMPMTWREFIVVFAPKTPKMKTFEQSRDITPSGSCRLNFCPGDPPSGTFT